MISPQWASGWVPSGCEAEVLNEGLESNTAWYGHEKKKKLWVSMTGYIHLPPSVRLSHTTEDLSPRRIKRVIFLLWRNMVSCFITVYNTRRRKKSEFECCSEESVIYESAILLLSAHQCGWSYASFYHGKQITCVSCQVVHILTELLIIHILW